jgi:hypothetical protein
MYTYDHAVRAYVYYCNGFFTKAVYTHVRECVDRILYD